MRRTTPVRYRFSASIVALLLVAPPFARAGDAPVTVAVRPSISWAGSDVRTTVRTPRDARNRELRIVIEAADYYASSDVQLDGADAAAMHQFTWKSLPGGAYRVEAILMRENGETESTSSCFAVLTGDEGDGGVSAARRSTPAPQADGNGRC